jgi:hypothetical protein
MSVLIAKALHPLALIIANNKFNVKDIFDGGSV